MRSTHTLEGDDFAWPPNPCGLAEMRFVEATIAARDQIAAIFGLPVEIVLSDAAISILARSRGAEGSDA